MSLTDPVADFLTPFAIRSARHQKLDVPASKLKTEIARILKEEGYIANYKPTEENGRNILRVYLKYGANNEPRSAISPAFPVPAAAFMSAAMRSSACRVDSASVSLPRRVA